MKKLNHLSIIPVVVFVFLCLFSVRAQGQSAEISGTWIMKVETSGGSGSPVFILKQEQDTIIGGTYTGLFGKANVNGTLIGNTINIKFTASDIQMEYCGTVEGDSMKGTVKFGNMGEGTFTGKKQEE